MSRKKDVRVVPRDNGWAVTRDRAERASRLTETQSEAIDIARGIAQRERVELVIHGRNGQIREKDSFGNDRFPPKG